MKAPGANCDNCPGLDRDFVPPERAANGRTHLTVVGDNPGYQEVADHKPFVGAAGRMLTGTLKRLCGLQRGDVHWTTAVLCDVPEEQLAAARKCCAQRLRDELEDSATPAVLAVGAFGLQSAAGLGRKPSILKMRGSVLAPDDPLRVNNRALYDIIASLHPTFVMRAELWAPIFEADVARAGRIARDGFVAPEKRAGAEIVVAVELSQLRAALARLGHDVIVDIETIEASGTNKGKGPDIHTNLITCLVLSDTLTAVVVPWSRTQHGDGRFWGTNHDEVVSLINATLATRIAVTHNGPAYDHTGLERAGIVIGKWDDSLLGYHVITSLFPKRLGHVVACYVDAPPWKEWDHNVSLEELWQYNGRDGMYTALAWQALRATMDDSDRRVYESDKDSATICRRMSANGFRFDRERAAEISEALAADEARITAECSELADMPEINLLSPKQLQKAVFGQLGAHVCFRSESGAPCLNKEALRAYAAGGDERLRKFALNVLEYRSARKCRSTYVDNIKVHADGRVRPTWLSYGTVSGRWSSQGPNLANLPSTRVDPSMKLGGIRSLYIAGEGRRLVAFDIKQAEFRVAAYMSGDANMIAVCNDPSGDIHTANAITLFSAAFQQAPPAKQKELRSLAKKAVFAVCYLAEAPTVHSALVSEGISITLQQVQAMLSAMQRQFRDYYAHQARLLDLTINRGYVESPVLGRKRWLGHAPSPPENANFPIQSGAADIMNLKLAKIERLLAERGIDARIVAMVYDAGYWDVAERDVEKTYATIQEVFDEPVLMNGRELVLPIDAHDGLRWSELG